MNRTERQGHGFIFEEYVENTLGIDRSDKKYTDKWDGRYGKYPVSIKHIASKNAVCMADLFRQATVNEDFLMIVDFYSADSDDIHFLYIPCKEYNKYFMPLEQFYDKFKFALDSVSNDHCDDEKWTQLRKDCVSFWKKNTNGIITVNGKRDHKSQKRWQCSINYTNFCKEFLPKYEISEEEFYAKRDEK